MQIDSAATAMLPVAPGVSFCAQMVILGVLATLKITNRMIVAG